MARNFVAINLGAAHSEDFVILVCTVLIQLTSVTDRQTPRGWQRRAKLSAFALKNESNVSVDLGFYAFYAKY